MKTRSWLAIPLILSLFVGTSVGLLLALTQDLPQVEALQTYEPSAVTTILAEDGVPIKSLFTERRIPVSLEEIPTDLVKAVIAVEDSRFFQHFGLDIKGISRALWRDLTSMRVVEGGSTLTQQLAKVLFLTPERTLIRKLKEAVLTLNIERRYSKEEILTIYLNQIYLGEGAYGVEAAARTYFDKSSSQLSLPECALIAGLPKSPSRYSPISHPDRARSRMRIVLKRLLDEGYISVETFEKAVEDGFRVAAEQSPEDLAPYFTELVRQRMEEVLGPNQLYRGGLIIETTLSRDLQEAANRAVAEGLNSYERRHPGKREAEPVQAGFIALDPATGQIKAIVGGRDFASSPFNRATQARRQPGSAFKPILYAAALASGYSPSDILRDAPVEIDIQGQEEPWIPRNYSGEYDGPVTVRTAIERSLNAASVDLLLKVGYQAVMDNAHRMGITTDLKPYPSLALGTFDVSLLEMVSAYGIFANRGIHVRPFLIKRVMNREGSVIWENTAQYADALDPRTAYQVTNLLEGVVQRGTGKRARVLDRPVAGKTGTTDDYHDAWFIGYVPGLVAGAWLGFDLPETLGQGEAGGRVALPVWIQFMSQALEQMPSVPFQGPEGLEIVEVDPRSGLLAGPECEDRIAEAYLPGTAPDRVCSHRVYNGLTEIRQD